MKKCISLTISANKRFALFLSCLLMLSAFSSFAQTKTDYTGTWTLNESKSQLPAGQGRRAASKIVLTQDVTSLNAEKTSTRQNGETATTKEKYNFDGSEVDNSSNNRKKKSTATWSADMKEFTVNSTSVFERNGNTSEMKSVEVFKLSSDKSTLTIETSGSSLRGDYKSTLVYDLTK